VSFSVSDILTELRKRLGSRDDLTDPWLLARVNEALNVLNREVEESTLQQASTTFNTVSDQSDYSIDTNIGDNFMFLYRMSYADPVTTGETKEIGILSRADLESLQLDSDKISEQYEGYPFYAAIWGDTLTLKPTPDSAITITVLYVKRIASLDTTTLSFDLTNYEYDILLCGALWRANEALQDKTLSEYYREEFFDGLESFRSSEISKSLKGLNINVDFPEKTK